MHADTIKPLGDLTDGSQPWGAYQCGTAQLAPSNHPAGKPANPSSASAPGAFETYPVKGG
jgi:hypothetical protein